MTAVISARGLTKRYGKQVAVDNVSFEIPAGRIIGLIGPNGSGKTTTLKAALGLISFEGDLKVLGLDPRTHRDELMEQVCFIADVAVLPRWLRVSEAIDFVAGVHPKFDRSKAERYLAHTKLRPSMKVKEMSKGMIVQLHLALVMAIDAKLLVLDEPTLGLDLLFRRSFYDNLLNDYFEEGGFAYGKKRNLVQIFAQIIANCNGSELRIGNLPLQRIFGVIKRNVFGSHHKKGHPSNLVVKRL